MVQEHLIAPATYNIVDEIERFAQQGDKTALIIEHGLNDVERVSYRALIDRAFQLANVFVKHGLQKGDVVIMMVPRSFEAYALYIAALKVGLVIIPSSELLRAKDIEYRLLHAEAKAIVTFEENVHQFDGVQGLEQVLCFVANAKIDGWISIVEEANHLPTTYEGAATASSDLAFLAYTSGTTGNPKAAMHPHAWGYAHIRTTAKQWLGVQEGDIAWATAAPGWQKWIWSPFLAVLGSGATAFVYTGKFDAKRYLELLEQYEVNVLCCTPTEYRMMAKEPALEQFKLAALRSAVSAGEPLNREVINVFQRQFNVTVRDGYGQTENTLLIGTLLGMEPRPGSMGQATQGDLVAVIDDEGQVLPAGEVGDIAVHKSVPALFAGYYKEAERTTMQYRGDWYITGDRAHRDEDGYFWFEGRSDDIIISSGYTIGPFEVEDALTKHPAVRECAVVASPDEVRGSVVKAFVVLVDPALKDSLTIVHELQDHVKELTAPYKYPRQIEFLDELPKTISGKIRRVELRKAEFSKQS